MSRSAVILVATLLALALDVAVARADIGVISVRPARAHPGQLVTVTAGAYRRFPRMPLYLVPEALARERIVPHPPRRAPYVRVGTLDFRSHPRRVQVRFPLPRLAPGLYVFLIYCDPCHRGSGGTLLSSSNPGTVLRVEH